MLAEIISIGDELLIGQVINTNSSWIAQKLNEIGIKVYQISTVSDDRRHILNALDEAKQRAQLIIITGGIGPTKDDLTKTTLCEYFNTHLVFNEEAFRDIEELFGKRGNIMSESNRKQAELPAECVTIKNYNGTARGMWFEKDGCIFISLPGVPFEMKAMITDYIIPKLVSILSVPSPLGEGQGGVFQSQYIIHKTILTTGIGESFLSETIADWENRLPDYIKLAYLPSPGLVRLRLSIYSGSDRSHYSGSDRSRPVTLHSREEMSLEIDQLIKELNTIIPEYIYGYDDDTLEEIAGKLLKAKGKTLSTAESCTGGNVAHLITSIPGSSHYFIGSVVAYSNSIKENILSVNPYNLDNFGAVSEQVAIDMAFGVKRKFNTDYSIAITGIAGPGGGTDGKPVGTTWIAIATPDKVFATKYMFGDNRERNITRASITALNMLRKQLANIL